VARAPAGQTAAAAADIGAAADNPDTSVISHIVFFRPHISVTSEQRRTILMAVAGVARRCPTVRACRVGRRVLHGLPGYEQAMREDYEYAMVLEFDDVDGLRAYLTHPEHGQLGGFFTAAAAASLTYDFDLRDPDEALESL
jgi:Stress responsive A/B Barrel Domain